MPNIIETMRDTYAIDKAAALNMLPELFRQYEDGLIPVLPCKIGDTVWSAAWSDEPEPYSVKYYDFADTSEQLFHALNEDETQWEDFSSKDFGKTVFLTRAEAEEALKEGKA